MTGVALIPFLFEEDAAFAFDVRALIERKVGKPGQAAAGIQVDSCSAIFLALTVKNPGGDRAFVIFVENEVDADHVLVAVVVGCDLELATFNPFALQHFGQLKGTIEGLAYTLGYTFKKFRRAFAHNRSGVVDRLFRFRPVTRTHGRYSSNSDNKREIRDPPDDHWFVKD